MSLYLSEERNLRLALCGDVMLTRRLAVYCEDRYLQLRNLLNEADCAFANFESVAHTYDEGVPSTGQGTYMTTEPALLEDLKWLGIKLVSCANNHAYNYDTSGVMVNVKHLDKAGIAHAGSGRNLGEAVAPGYIDTPAGRVGLIAASATFDEFHRATPQRHDAIGKPGLNALGHRLVYEVDPPAFSELKRIGEGIGLEALKARRAGWFFAPSETGAGDPDSYTFLGRRFKQGEKFDVHTHVNKHDCELQLRQIREAKRAADWVVVSLHSHEMGGESFLKAQRQPDMDQPADFVHDFARACIDEGADVFVGHGPHKLLGAEVYKGKPIIYSLGDFIMQNETVRFFPHYAYERFGLDWDATPMDFLDARTANETKAHPAHPVYWESVVAMCDFRGGELKAIELHPVDLGFGRSRPQRGRPLIADEQVGNKILDDFERLSKPYGTRIERSGGIGIIPLQ